MRNSSFSSSQNRPTTSKSSTSSVCSILRDTSVSRPRKMHTVRFDDSPIYLEKTVQISLKESHFNSTNSAIRSPSHSRPSKQRLMSQFLTDEPLSVTAKQPIRSSPAKQAQIKIVAVEEIPNQIDEPRFVPKVMNYSFRNHNFYDKLSKYYNTNRELESPQKLENSEVGQAKLNSTLTDNRSKKYTEMVKSRGNENGGIIHLKPCLGGKEHRGKSSSPVRENKVAHKKTRGAQNILN